MLKNTLKLLLIPLAFYSCKKSEKETPQIEVKTEEKITDRDIAVSKISDDTNTQNPQGDSNYRILGYGYDVTDRYADIHSVRKPVVDLQKYFVVFPNRLYVSRSTSGGSEELRASDIKNLSEKISAKYKDTNNELTGFRNTFTSAFPGASPFSKKYVYGYYTYIMQWKSLSTEIYYDHGKGYLTKEFELDVQALSPKELVAKYGTHVLSAITLGAKFTAIYQAETSSEDRYSSLAYGFNYAMKKVFFLNTSDLYTVTPPLNSVISPKIAFKFVGGDVSKIKIDDTKKTPTFKTFWDWANTASEGREEFIDIGKNGTVPLSEMIEDPNKKKAVEEYIQSYLAENEIKTTV